MPFYYHLDMLQLRKVPSSSWSSIPLTGSNLNSRGQPLRGQGGYQGLIRNLSDKVAV